MRALAPSLGVGTGFEGLAVYREAAALSDDIDSAVSEWESFARWTVGVQIVRAADSIGANIAEGYGRRTDLDRRRFLFLARGSVCELQHWLMRARERKLSYPSGALERADEVGRMLNGLTKSWSAARARTPSD